LAPVVASFNITTQKLTPPNAWRRKSVKKASKPPSPPLLKATNCYSAKPPT